MGVNTKYVCKQCTLVENYEAMAGKRLSWVDFSEAIVEVLIKQIKKVTIRSPFSVFAEIWKKVSRYIKIQQLLSNLHTPWLVI